MAAHHCRITQAMAIALCDALVDKFDAGGAGKLVLYTGSEPANCDAAEATEVATCTLPNPAFGAASYDPGTGAAVASLSSDAVDASATGNASAITHFRLCQNDDTAVLQGTASATAGDDLVMNAAIITAGSQVTIDTLVLAVAINQA